MIEPVDLPSLLGVWTRRWIRRPDQPPGAATRVFWLQGPSWYGDIRIPALRPSFTGVNRREECNPEQLAYLNCQEGFCGELIPIDNAWLWQRELDYQPPSGKRDIGRLTYRDSSRNLMLEEGVDEPYTELWERIDDGLASPPIRTHVQDADGNPATLITVGRHFLLFVSHAGAASLEVSHGLIDGPIENCTIVDSTHPWREGRPIKT